MAAAQAMAGVGGGAADPTRDASTSQLVQAMAGFAGGSGAGESLNAAPLGADMSQQTLQTLQTLLTTPQHA
jgi:hypothetical protein